MDIQCVRTCVREHRMAFPGYSVNIQGMVYGKQNAYSLALQNSKMYQRIRVPFIIYDLHEATTGCPVTNHREYAEALGVIACCSLYNRAVVPEKFLPLNAGRYGTTVVPDTIENFTPCIKLSSSGFSPSILKVI
ncbi:hypothetical protein AVEN_185263-1 [Araneus ventricosus]|uniref:Uncharacterized protein n=1 Tax=Araneus ventricosus TaxID=182803 RepID=A0A4Y2MI37_ARAVE|nr:hypothetical protein AVEN_185263-1 [Araneus ventricosus]